MMSLCKMQNVLSPLCGTSRPRLKRRIDVASIVRSWDRAGFDVSGYFEGCDEVHLMECPVSRLEFYGPGLIVGRDSLYEFLGSKKWYYDEGKWELQEASRAIVDAGLRSVLEVGCGSGNFLAIAKAAGLDAVGVDINAQAVAVATRKGLSASTRSLTEVRDSGERFDAVVAFQVLEHVCNPLRLLEEISALVRVGGSVCLAVPNADSWISRRLSLLDTVPHHYTRWRMAAFQYVCRILPLECVDVRYQPMTPNFLPAWALALCDPDPHPGEGLTVIGRRASLKRRLLARAVALGFGALAVPKPAEGPSLFVRLCRREF